MAMSPNETNTNALPQPMFQLAEDDPVRASERYDIDPNVLIMVMYFLRIYLVCFAVVVLKTILTIYRSTNQQSI
jgi:hypothetical protein